LPLIKYREKQKLAALKQYAFHNKTAVWQKSVLNAHRQRFSQLFPPAMLDIWPVKNKTNRRK